MGEETNTITDDERLDWLRLQRTRNVGPITFYKLLERFGTASAALAALPNLGGRGGKTFKPATMAEAEREREALTRIGGQLVTRLDDAYPPLLAQAEDAPPVLSVLGHRELLRKRAVAVVGARNASLNGNTMAARMAGELGRAGLLVVSGLARGIDTSAHKGALETGTVAVVAGGVDVVYPKENQNLYDSLLEQGAVISEKTLGEAPKAHHFPQRNRIISGMARATVVVEAGLKSGSLITARMALEQNREVFAVPGSPMDPRAEGVNRLIKEGAYLAQSAKDVLDGLSGLFQGPAEDHKPLQFKEKIAPLPDANESAKALEAIAQMLSVVPVTVDELLRNCQFSPAVVSLALLELELAGRAARYPGNRVALIA